MTVLLGYFVIIYAFHQEFIMIYREECHTLLFPCRKAFHKVMMQQQDCLVCAKPEVKNLLKLLALTMLRTAIFAEWLCKEHLCQVSI